MPLLDSRVLQIQLDSSLHLILILLKPCIRCTTYNMLQKHLIYVCLVWKQIEIDIRANHKFCYLFHDHYFAFYVFFLYWSYASQEFFLHLYQNFGRRYGVYVYMFVAQFCLLVLILKRFIIDSIYIDFFDSTTHADMNERWIERKRDKLTETVKTSC